MYVSSSLVCKTPSWFPLWADPPVMWWWSRDRRGALGLYAESVYTCWTGYILGKRKGETERRERESGERLEGKRGLCQETCWGNQSFQARSTGRKGQSSCQDVSADNLSCITKLFPEKLRKLPVWPSCHSSRFMNRKVMNVFHALLSGKWCDLTDPFIEFSATMGRWLSCFPAVGETEQFLAAAGRGTRQTSRGAPN